MQVYLSGVDVQIDPNGVYTVSPVWAGVDRPNAGGTSTGKNQLLAYRLAIAWHAGVVCDMSKVTIETDIHGQTYANVPMLNVRGRTLNADLKKLGY